MQKTDRTVQENPGASVGDYKYSAQTGDHNGWLLCDGRTNLSRATYADLFALIGTTFGNADGNTFGVVDARDKLLMTAGGTHSIASTGGQAEVTLTEGNLPGHTHTMPTGDVQSGTGATVVISGGGTNLDTGSTGSAAPINILPPYAVGGSWFIYAGV